MYDSSASGLTEESHRVSLWKRTEAEVGVVTLHGLTITGAEAGLAAAEAEWPANGVHR